MVAPWMTLLSQAAVVLSPESVVQLKCTASRTRNCGSVRFSNARWTLIRVEARAANAAKSGTGGRIRSGRASRRFRSWRSLRAARSWAKARIADTVLTLPRWNRSALGRRLGAVPPAHSCDHQHHHEKKRGREAEVGNGNESQPYLPLKKLSQQHCGQREQADQREHDGGDGEQSERAA